MFGIISALAPAITPVVAAALARDLSAVMVGRPVILSALSRSAFGAGLFLWGCEVRKPCTMLMPRGDGRRQYD